MMLRVQRERMSGGFFPTAREYTVGYGLTRARLDTLIAANPDAVICHPGPMNRGLEIAADAADAAQSPHPRPGVAPVWRCGCRVLYHLLAGNDDQREDPARNERGRTAEQCRFGHRREGQAVSSLLVTGADLAGAGRQDLLVEDGVIAEVGSIRGSGSVDVLDADGLVALPGPGRPAHPPARTRARGRRDDRVRIVRRGGGWLHRRPRHGEHDAGHRHRRGCRADPRPRPCRRPRRRGARRCGDQGPRRRRARRARPHAPLEGEGDRSSPTTAGACTTPA